MDELIIEVGLYSPRWGHEDQYKFLFRMDKLKISQGPSERTAEWIDGHDPVWKGRPLVEIMHNDLIWPPEGLEGLLEHIWQGWRNGHLTAEDMQREMGALAKYLNASTRAKPNTEFWKGVF